MIEMQKESVRTIYAEGQALAEAHWREVSLYQKERPLAIDWGKYEGLELERALAVFTLRDDRRLIGYATFLVNFHIHYKWTLTAFNDAVFVEPKYRDENAKEFLRFCNAELKKLGVDHILYHVKYARDFRPFLREEGFVDEEAIVGKFIKED